MKIGLIDVDRTGFPNLALMKLSAWHKQRGDSVILVRGDVGRLSEIVSCDKLYASSVFTWNRDRVLTWEAFGAEVGGSGLSLSNQLPPDVEAMRPDYSIYGIDYGVGFLMRGCIWTQETCPHCIVPIKEGKSREVSTVDNLVNRKSARRRPFVVLLDNEFFWREKWAIARLQEFTDKGIDFCPSQGLDVRVLTPALADALTISPFWNVGRTRRQITFAFDSLNYERLYRRGIELLLARMAAWHLQSFVLVGHRSTLTEDLARIDIIRSYHVDPFVMVYRDQTSGKMIRNQTLENLARWVNRRLYKIMPFENYRRTKAERDEFYTTTHVPTTQEGVDQ